MKKLILANWKMNGNKKMAQKFVLKLSNINSKNSNIILCLPYPYLYIGEQNNKFNLGAQNCHHEEKGAYTGDISAEMLSDMGCKYVILGHSERRSKHNESDRIIQKKAKIALKNFLIPIICVGEKERSSNFDFIKKQCDNSLYDDCIIAYEPVWAIGSNITPELDKIENTANILHENYKLPIIYGGSINTDNACKIAKIKFISGLLIGGASLNINSFLQIVHTIG